MLMTEYVLQKRLHKESKSDLLRFYWAKRIERPGSDKPSFTLTGNLVPAAPVIKVAEVQKVQEEPKPEAKPSIFAAKPVSNPFARADDNPLFKKTEPPKEQEPKQATPISLFAPKPVVDQQ